MKTQSIVHNFVLLSTLLSPAAFARPIDAGLEGQEDRNVRARCMQESDVGKYAIASMPGTTPERSTRFSVSNFEGGFSLNLTTLMFQCEEIQADLGKPIEYWWNTIAPPAGRGMSVLARLSIFSGKKYQAPLTSREVEIGRPLLPRTEVVTQTESTLALKFEDVLARHTLRNIMNGDVEVRRFDVRVAVPESRTLNYLYYVDVRFERSVDARNGAVSVQAVIQ